MPNSIVSFYREQYPQDTRSDYAIMRQYVADHGIEALQQYPDFIADLNAETNRDKRLFAPSLWGEVKQGLAGGTDLAQAKLFDTAALAGDVFHLGAISRWGQEGYERNLAESAQNEPTIPSYTDVEGIGDVPRYLAGLASSQAPQIAGTLAGSALGAGVGFLAAGPAGVGPGAAIGGGAAGFTQMQNRGELRSMPGVDQSSVVPTALGVGLLGAAFEQLVPTALVGSIAKKFVPLRAISPALANVPAATVETYLSKVLKEVPVKVLEEGGTEVAQELVAIAGEDYANRANPDFKRAPNEIRDRLINVGIAGGVLGAPFGLVPGGHGQQQVQQTAQQDTARARAAAAAVAPLVPPVQSVLGGVSTDNDGLDEEIDYEVDPLAAMRTAAANFGVEEEVVPAAPVPVQAQPVAAVPVGDQQIRDDLKLQGVKDPDIDALILGTKTPAQVVEENLASVGYVGLATAGQNQGHADAFEAGFNQAVNNIADILNGDRPSGDTRRRQSLPVEAAAVPSVPVEQPAVVPVAAPVAVAQPEAAIVPAAVAEPVPAAVVPPPVVEPVIPVAPEPAAVVPTQAELVPRQTKELPLEQVDFKRATLPGATIQKAGTETDNPVWRAWKPSEKNDSNADAVGAELERGGSADPKNKSVTRRVAFFQDQANNGEIVGVPIYNLRGEKGYHVGNPEGDGGGALKTLLAKQFDGKQRFIPIGSALLSDGVKGREGEYRWRYKDAQHFLNSFLAPAAKMVAAQSGETGKNLDAFERMTNPNAQTETDDGHWQALGSAIAEELARDGIDISKVNPRDGVDAVRDAIQQNLDSDNAVITADQITRAALDSLTPDQVKEATALPSVNDKKTFIEQALMEHIYEAIKLSSSVEEVTQAISSLGGGSGVSERAGSAAESGASEPADPTVFSQPGPGSEREAQKASSPAIASRFNNLVERLTDFGISYEALSDSEELSGNIGAFSPSKNAITLVLADAENPTRGNLAVLLEEIGHAIVKDMPDDLRSAVLRAIAAVSDEKIGLDPTHDARLLNGTMPAGVLTEERLVKAMAQRGVNAPVARGIAANIVRFLKDLYFRAAIAMQRAFGRDPSASLAMAYMENRLRGFEGGTNFLMPLTGAVVPNTTPVFASASDAQVYYSAMGMIAPNGKPSKLNRGQWLQVRTPEFKAWFGDWEKDPQNASKVLDENGEPMVVYHGTSKEFTGFDSSKVGTNTAHPSNQLGFFFSPSPGVASDYATFNGKLGAALMPAFLNIRNPTEWNNVPTSRLFQAGMRDDGSGIAMAKQMKGLVESRGRDGIIIPGTGEMVAFQPNQIKSAIGNIGTFDASNSDIRFSGPSITDEKIGGRDNPQMIPETQIAAINEANEFWKSLDSRLRSEPSVAAAAKDAGVSALDWARQTFRLPDYEALKQEQTARLGPPGVALPINPNIRITDFKATQNTALANLKAYEMIQQAYAKIEGRLPDLGQRLADQTALRDRARAKFDAATLDYTNVKGLTATMLADFKSMYRRLFKDIATTSHNLGAISQQLLGLGVPVNSLRDYRALFQAMDTQGEKLFTLLDTMATDDKIDFTQTIASIKAAMVASGKPEYAALTNGTKEANALLATLVATAKRNEMVMLALELKWLGHGGNDAGLERRAKINDMLKTLSTEAESSMMPGGTTTVSLGDLPRTAAIEDRLKVAFTKEKARLAVYNRAITKVQTEIAAGRAVADQFRAKMWQMAGLNEIRPPVVIKDGAVFDMPKTNSPSQLGDFKSVTLRLSTANNSVTNMDEMTAAVGAMTEMLDEFDKTGRRDGFYYRIKAQRDFLTHHFVTDDIRQTDNTIFGLGLSTLGKQIGAIGTPTARLIEAGNNKVASKEKELHGQGVKLGLAVERHRIAAANALKIELAHYMRNYYDFGGDFLKRQRTIVEKYPNDPQRAFDESFKLLRRYIETDTSQREKAARIAHAGAKEQAEFWTEYKAHLEAEIENSQHWNEITNGIGYGAVDDRAKVEVERGKFVPGYRARIERGTMTVPQTLSKGVVSPMFAAMAQANWQGLDVSRIAELYNSGDLAGLHAVLAPYFSAPEIQDSFFRGIAELPTFSPFMAPALSTDPNTIPEANPALVKAAFDASGGNITNFIVQMYQMHRGTPGLGPDFGAYAQGIMGVFNDYFHQLLANRQSFNPEEMGKSPKDWSTMIQPFMLTARQSENMPASWLELVSFDLMQNQRIGQRVAATFGFGPNQENLAEWHATVAKEVGEAATKLLAASTWVEANEPSTDPKIREAALVNRVGSKTELARLRRMTDLAKFVPQFQDQMIQIYRGKNSVTRPARFLHQLINLFAGWMVNQPSSALSQLSEGFSPLFAYGASPLTIKSTLRIAYRTGSILAESLANAVGVAFKHQDAAYQRFMDTGKGDPGAFLKLTDAMLPVETRYDDDASFSGKALRKMSRGVHVLRGFTQQGLNFVGDRAGAATFRPLAPFLTMSNAIQAACTIELGRTADELVSKGIEAQTKLGVTFKPGEDLGAIAEKLGYKGGDKSTFVRLFTFARDGYGLDYATLVKEGERNQSKGKDRLSERTLGLLQGLGIKETTSESNIATMNSHFLTDSILRASMPLLSWSFRRAGKVASLRYDAENKASTAATLRGVLALAALAGGGLAVSALMDVYNDELLKKRRNLRRLSLDGGGTNLALAVLEHSTRIGTFGFFGEVANSAVNVGTGGDNRGISLDNRIVFMNSAIGFTRAMSAFLNQDFTADWANVVRPTLQSLGGGGALQYMQLANRLFGADNAESEMVARSNMSNWLRVVGREQGMEVRPFTGGYNSPTPMTPYVTRMQLAAFGNDPQTFSAAYRDAIRQAQVEGKPDPAKYVEESFSSRNPLKTVFRTAPSEAEYHKILMALPSDGREAVVQGMALINRYGATIGVRPWEGKVERAPGGNVRQNASPFSTSLGGVRDRAAMFGAPAGF